MHITLGQAIWSSVKPIIKIYLIIGTGFLLSKMNILTAEATRTISDVVLTVLLPCLSFNKIVANIEDNDIKMVGIICLTSVLVFGTGLFFAYVIRRFMPVPRKWYGGILAGGMFPNISDLPIAYLQTMDQGFIFTEEEGEKGVANVIIFLAMFLICVFNLGGFRLIENDFHYNDEENAVHEDDYANSDQSNNNSLNERSSQSSSIINEKDNNKPTDELDEQEKAEQLDKMEHGIHTPSSDSTEDGYQVADSLGSSSSDNKQEALNKPPQAYHSNEQLEYNKKKNKNSDDLHMTVSNDTNISPNENMSIPNTLLTTESLPASSILTESSIDSDEYSTNYDARDDIARRTISQPVAYTSQTKDNKHNRNYHHQRYHRHENMTTGYQSFRDEINNLDRIVSLRSIENRDLPPQTMHDIIHEYSNVDQFGKRRRTSVTSDGASNLSGISQQSTLQRIKSSNLTKILTSDATVSKKDIEESGSSLPPWLQKFPLTPLIVFFLKNCLRPCSMAVIIALTIAFIPWVKALFVTTSTTPNINQAPDQQPALSFIMDYTSYVGAASVPFGLLLLGATLGRLKIGKLYPGFWKSACLLVFLRQCIMPIFGVLWCDRLVKAGWVNWEDDKMLLFVIAVTWNLPTMTTLIYFTASYTPPDTLEPIQMECVSFFLMIQYPVMVVSLPFLVSYFLKVQMKL